MAKALRTRKGNVTAKARKKHGMKSKTAKKKSFPIFDKKSAKSALRLRGHAKSRKDRKNIINRARKWAPTEASKAYKTDKHNKQI